MKAIVQTGYGSPDHFELVEKDKPVIKNNEILVKVRAAALHGGDLFFMRGIPYMVRFMAGLPRPKNYIPGYDVAGIVEEVGKSVKEFKAGDEVFGAGQRTCAEFTAVKEKTVCSNQPT
jgi:NADPH:quinone reductase-like Zn-dependent oxidoreductase